MTQWQIPLPTYFVVASTRISPVLTNRFLPLQSHLKQKGDDMNYKTYYEEPVITDKKRERCVLPNIE